MWFWLVCYKSQIYFACGFGMVFRDYIDTVKCFRAKKYCNYILFIQGAHCCRGRVKSLDVLSTVPAFDKPHYDSLALV